LCEREIIERKRPGNWEVNLGNRISAFWHVRLRELRVEDSVGVQEKIQRAFGLENHQEFEFESEKSRLGGCLLYVYPMFV